MPTLNYSTENETKDKRIFEIILQSKLSCSHYIQKNRDKFMVMIETYINNYDKNFNEYKQLLVHFTKLVNLLVNMRLVVIYYKTIVIINLMLH